MLFIIFKIQKVIANFLKHKYRCSQIGSPPEAKIKMVLEENLFVHSEQNEQVWVVGSKKII